MLEYLAILLVFSLILTAILSLLKKYIPLSPRIIYGTVGISFILGAFFPVTITTLSPAVVMAVYFGLIVIIAVALGYAESRIFLNTSSATLLDNVLEHENSAEIPVDDYDLSVEETADSPVHMTANEHHEDETGIDISAGLQEFGYTNSPEDVISIGENIPAEEEELIPVPELSSNRAQQVTAEPVSPRDIAADEAAAAEAPDEAPAVVADEAPAVAGDIWRDEDQTSHGQENNESREDITDITDKTSEDVTDKTTFPVTINDFISAGFKARTTGDLIGAVKYFMAAFQMNREQHMSTTLALEISTVYQGLGQYSQAMLILKSVIEQENLISEPDLRQKINERLIYLEILAELLKITKMPQAPYSKIPDIIKIKANLEKDKKLIELNQGGGIN